MFLSRTFLVVSIGCASVLAVAAADFQTVGVKDDLPVFYQRISERLTFPLSWQSGHFTDFATWKKAGQAKVQACWLTSPPRVEWNAEVLEEEDRGTYVARKIVFNLSADSRVLAYMTVPKGPGPFPAALLLHDHGSKFDIGKEKLIRPWNIAAEKITSANDWAKKYYGGKFIGDELAQRGYVCLAIDALNWSDRGGGGYEGQQRLEGNLLHFGMSFAGLIAWDDLSSADFIAAQTNIDPQRITAVGFSMGAARAWQLAAISPHISAAVAVCWMNDVQHLMVPGNNETRGGSTFALVHPGLLDQLDYPDVASLACPKPMLFFNGAQDGLLPVAGVQAAYAKMHAVWASQAAADRLQTRIWETAHIFNAEMQSAAFAWLDQINGKAAHVSSETKNPSR